MQSEHSRAPSISPPHLDCFNQKTHSSLLDAYFLAFTTARSAQRHVVAHIYNQKLAEIGPYVQFYDPPSSVPLSERTTKQMRRGIADGVSGTAETRKVN